MPLSLPPQEGLLLIQIQPMPEGAQVILADSGIGMDEATLVSLTSSCQSRPGTNGEKGTGIGLRLVDELMAANQGRLTIQSQVSVGTSIDVFF